MRRSRILKTLLVLTLTTLLVTCDNKHSLDSVESCIVVDRIENEEYGLVRVEGRLWGNNTHKNFYSPNIQPITIFLKKSRKVFPGDTIRFNLD